MMERTANPDPRPSAARIDLPLVTLNLPEVERETMEAWVRDCGLNPIGWQALPPARDAKGPLLFVATARKP